MADQSPEQIHAAGEEIARQLGNSVRYDGPFMKDGHLFGYAFTDVAVTGTTFLCHDVEDCKSRLQEKRREFGAAAPEYSPETDIPFDWGKTEFRGDSMTPEARARLDRLAARLPLDKRPQITRIIVTTKLKWSEGGPGVDGQWIDSERIMRLMPRFNDSTFYHEIGHALGYASEDEAKAFASQFETVRYNNTTIDDKVKDKQSQTLTEVVHPWKRLTREESSEMRKYSAPRGRLFLPKKDKEGIMSEQPKDMDIRPRTVSSWRRATPEEVEALRARPRHNRLFLPKKKDGTH